MRHRTIAKAMNIMSLGLFAVLCGMVSDYTQDHHPVGYEDELFSTRPGVPNVMVALRPIIWMEANSDLITCETLVRRFEGMKLKAYKDVRSVWTIGAGHTKGVYPGMTITREQAEQFLRDDIAIARKTVSEEAGDYLNRQQQEATCSLVVNIGAGAFKRSTLLRRIREGDHQAAQTEFAQWKRAGTVKPKGLAIRRYVEAKVFAL